MPLTWKSKVMVLPIPTRFPKKASLSELGRNWTEKLFQIHFAANNYPWSLPNPVNNAYLERDVHAHHSVAAKNGKKYLKDQLSGL